MKNLLLSLIIGSCCPLFAQTDVSIPKGYTVLGEALGDLDKDHIAEKVVVFDTNREDTEYQGTIREVHIFKKIDNDWELWHRSKGCVMSGRQGRMGLDRFEEVKIERACIVVSHFMGSALYKSFHTHRFRYQNNTWELIGATTLYGSPCQFWEKFDYNLSIGKIIYEKETEDCTHGTTKKESKIILKKLKVLPKMDGFSPANNEMKFIDLDGVFYY